MSEPEKTEDLVESHPDRPVNGLVLSKPEGLGKEESEVDCTSPATLEIINEIYGHKFTKVTRKESVPWTEEENAALLQAMEIFGTKWRRVADHMKTRDNSQCREHWLKVLSPSIKKGKWTADEDKNLMHIMSFGFRNWKIVSELCPGRTSKQCRERWCNYLCSKMKEKSYSKADDQQLMRLSNIHGKRWYLIAKIMCRSVDSVQSRYRFLRIRGFEMPPEDEQALLATLTQSSGSANLTNYSTNSMEASDSFNEYEESSHCNAPPTEPNMIEDSKIIFKKMSALDSASSKTRRPKTEVSRSVLPETVRPSFTDSQFSNIAEQSLQMLKPSQTNHVHILASRANNRNGRADERIKPDNGVQVDKDMHWTETTSKGSYRNALPNTFAMHGYSIPEYVTQPLRPLLDLVADPRDEMRFYLFSDSRM